MGAETMTVRDEIFALVQDLDDATATRVRDYVADLLWEQWDRQIEDNAAHGRLGKLEALAKKAHEDRAAGRTTPL